MIEDFREWTPQELGKRLTGGPGEAVCIRVVDPNGATLINDLTVMGLDTGTDFDRSGGYAWTEIVAQREWAPRPIGVPPWTTETVAVPQRIDGWRVVAAVKLRDEPGQPPYRYAVVVEAMPGPGFLIYPLVLWRKGTGFEVIERGPLTSYDECMSRFVSVIAGIR